MIPKVEAFSEILKDLDKTMSECCHTILEIKQRKGKVSIDEKKLAIDCAFILELFKTYIENSMKNITKNEKLFTKVNQWVKEMGKSVN